MNYNFKRFFFRSGKFDPICDDFTQESTNQSSPDFTDLTKLIRKTGFGFLIISFGVILAASSGSWDITNHLLNRPETFFSPPHAGLYAGVALVVFALVRILRYYRYSSYMAQKRHSSLDTDNNVSIATSDPLLIPIKVVSLGVLLLVAAGPFDFAWHSAYGLDGLLSPSHLVLTMGLILSSVGALLGVLSTRPKIENYQKQRKAPVGLSPHKHNLPFFHFLNIKSTIVVTLAMLPVWITLVGLTHMLSLPFSDTEYFKFNPDPTLGAILATTALPFIGAFLITSSFQFTRRFGIVSLTGGSFIFINLATSILPNEYAIPTIPFYILNLIPFLMVDIILSKLFVLNNRTIIYGISGAIVGATFLMLYFPLITYTYNEVMPNANAVWPSQITFKYFKMNTQVYPIVALPSMITGFLGALFGSGWKKYQILVES